MRKIVLMFAVIIFSSGCSVSHKIQTAERLIKEEAIRIAIQDFTTHGGLFKKNEAFLVHYSDSVFKKASLEYDEETKVYYFKEGEYMEGLVWCGISSAHPWFYSLETEDTLPSRFVIIDDKLFLWKDDNYPVTEEIINVMWYYDLLVTTEIEIFGLPIDESAKGTSYYFSKDNLNKYKRIDSNLAHILNEPPEW